MRYGQVVDKLRASRHYARCAACLSVAAVDGVHGWGESIEIECGFCGGERWLYMGRVVADALVRDRIKDVCDATCQCAKGPSCNCKCGGANHGAGLVVTWDVTPIGALPKLTPKGDAVKARGVAWDWFAAREVAREAWDARYGDLCRRKWAGEWIPDFGTYLTGDDLARRLRKAGMMTSQAGRLKAAAEVMRACTGPVTSFCA